MLGSVEPVVSKRSFADLLLFGVTAVELAILFKLTPDFTLVDWIYVLQHLIVMAAALARVPPVAWDHSIRTGIAVAVAYLYPYAQVIYIHWVPGVEASYTGGLVLVTIAAWLSLASLITLGRRFGIRPALRGLETRGPYRLLRHPMYLSYVLADIGYNLQEWNVGTVLLVIAGWLSLLYRIRAEEQVVAGDQGWSAYASRVHYRLIPWVW